MTVSRIWLRTRNGNSPTDRKPQRAPAFIIILFGEYFISRAESLSLGRVGHDGPDWLCNDCSKREKVFESVGDSRCPLFLFPSEDFSVREKKIKQRNKSGRRRERERESVCVFHIA